LLLDWQFLVFIPQIAPDLTFCDTQSMIGHRQDATAGATLSVVREAPAARARPEAAERERAGVGPREQ